MQNFILTVFRVPEENVGALGFRYVTELREDTNGTPRLLRNPIWRKTKTILEMSDEFAFLNSLKWRSIEDEVTRMGLYKSSVEIDYTTNFPPATI